MECVTKNCARHTPFIQMLYIGLVDNAWLQSVFPKPNPAKLLFWCSTLFFSCQIKSGNGESWIAYGPADREREYETKPRVQLAWKTKNTTSQMLLYSGLVPIKSSHN